MPLTESTDQSFFGHYLRSDTLKFVVTGHFLPIVLARVLADPDDCIPNPVMHSPGGQS